jgi:hydroxylamine reductase
MFCYQCEQTKRGVACFDRGNCGKDETTAVLQDLLLYVGKGIAMFTHRAGHLGAHDIAIDRFVADILFTTVTNVNFDPARLDEMLAKAETVRANARALYEKAAAAAGQKAETLAGPAAAAIPADREGRIALGRETAIDKRTERLGPDIVGLHELLTYGIKGAAAYSCHARILGREDAAIYAFFNEALSILADEPDQIEGLLALNLRCGDISYKTLALLDGANTGAFGKPTPTPVHMGGKKGKAILVSGHDLEDLKHLLEQTAGTGINVYTHGEMLPAHGYPELKKHPHLAGHFGGAWQVQRREFDAFPGPILMTTNCIQEPAPSYKGRIFTSGLVAWPDVTHIADHDFKPVIDAALAAPGFAADEEARTHIAGFGHDAVLGVADQVIAAVKGGAIKRFVLIGGCDGAESGRNYYTQLAETMPKDWVVLTLGCGKFRVVNSDLGTIGGLPRLLDMGQCNDAYSAIQVAIALAGAFGCGVNDLPLSLVVSWYEQKAVAVLLALLHLGVRNIRLGPKLPAFLTPALLDVLVKKFNIMPIGTVDDDIQAMMAA